MEKDKKPTIIKSFRDLIVYQNLYKAMLIILKKIVPKLPPVEKYDPILFIKRRTTWSSQKKSK
jgi:hypothetical protein